MHIIYQVKRDHGCQFVWAVDSHGDLMMDGSPRKNEWTPVAVYNRMPQLEETDFYQYHPSGLIINERALEAFGQAYLETYAEVLPLICDEPHCPAEKLYLINVTECVNCLDHAKTVWKGLSRILFVKPAFRSERLPWPGTLFKIPETSATAVYLCEDTDASTNAFREVMERSQLRGLIFETIWQSE
jgi:hypothetical protein